MTPIDTLLQQLQKVMAEIPEIVISDALMPDAEKDRLSRLYDTLLIFYEELETAQKKASG